jgi:hypothetical protein
MKWIFAASTSSLEKLHTLFPPNALGFLVGADGMRVKGANHFRGWTIRADCPYIETCIQRPETSPGCALIPATATNVGFQPNSLLFIVKGKGWLPYS